MCDAEPSKPITNPIVEPVKADVIEKPNKNKTKGLKKLKGFFPIVTLRNKGIIME